SSNSTVPPSAAANKPCRALSAPVKAPAAWPNSSLSSRLAGIPPQLIAEGLIASRAFIVQRPRDQLLTDAAFTGNQHRTFCGRNLAGQRKLLTHGIAATDHAVGFSIVPPPGVISELFLQLLALQGALHTQTQVIKIQGLGKEVVGAAFEGIDGLIDGAEGSDYNKPRFERQLGKVLEERQTVAIRQRPAAGK